MSELLKEVRVRPFLTRSALDKSGSDLTECRPANEPSRALPELGSFIIYMFELEFELELDRAAQFEFELEIISLTRARLVSSIFFSN